MNRGKTRIDMGEGCKEKIDWAFIKFIYTTYGPRKKKMKERFQAFQKNGSKKTIIELKSRPEINSYLMKIKTH